jgi:hypothetical protein
MEQSPSWEANRFAASQEISRVLLNPKVHYRIHNCPSPVSILSQPNPVHSPTSLFQKIHPNIILPSMPGTPQWSLSLRFPHQNRIHASLLSHPRYMPRPSNSSRFYHPHNIGWGVLSFSMSRKIPPTNVFRSFIAGPTKRCRHLEREMDKREKLWDQSDWGNLLTFLGVEWETQYPYKSFNISRHRPHFLLLRGNKVRS